MKDVTWIKIAETEMKPNNLNPDFDKIIIIDYYFEKHQPLRFEVIDDDGGGKFDMIGWVDTTLAAVMGAKKQTF